MTTADVVQDRVLALARSDADVEEAIHELKVVSEGRRVAVVRARQQLSATLEDASDPVAVRAIALLDELLQRMPA